MSIHTKPPVAGILNTTIGLKNASDYPLDQLNIKINIAGYAVIVVVGLYINIQFWIYCNHEIQKKPVRKNFGTILILVMGFMQVMQLVMYSIMILSQSCPEIVVTNILNRFFLGIAIVCHSTIMYIRTPTILIPSVLRKPLLWLLVIYSLVLITWNTILPFFGATGQTKKFACNQTPISINASYITGNFLSLAGLILDVAYTGVFVKHIMYGRHLSGEQDIATVIAWDGLKITIAILLIGILMVIYSLTDVTIPYNFLLLLVVYLWMNLKYKLDKIKLARHSSMEPVRNVISEEKSSNNQVVVTVIGTESITDSKSRDEN